MDDTLPKLRFPRDYKIDSSKLAAGRYGTLDMCGIWGDEETFEKSLFVQGQAALTLSSLHPDIVPPELAREMAEKANLEYIDPKRIRELEAKTGHDVIAINTALEEVVSIEAGVHINKAKTSADTTQPVRALQLKSSLEVIADSTENLRDITIEKSLRWDEIPFMVPSHLFDALPGVAGRPLAHYAEILQSDLNFLKFVYNNSIIGKWADATGDHHSATSFGIDGIELQRKYCEDLGIGFMDASAQVPGLEFEADVFFVMARTAETMNNLAKFIAWGKSDDVNVFRDDNPKRRKGSSAMPHKDVKGGNPTAEEQVMSVRNYTQGLMMTALSNCELPYARNLSASANSRINFDNGFKFLDHGIRRLASTVYWLGIDEARSIERIERTYGVTTSQYVMNYLTDSRRVSNPMTRSQAHELMGRLATYAWKNKISFTDVVLGNEEVRERLDEQTIRDITDPLTYLGESKRIVRIVANKYHRKKTLG